MGASNIDNNDWDLVILPKKKILALELKEVYEYRDLLYLFVKKDIITVYKQTVLGPVWFLIQPLLSTFVYIFVFGNIAKIPTDGIPSHVFYLMGIVAWTFFSSCFFSTANTFSQNMNVFGKVYFPRLIIPLSKISSAFVRFLIQFTMFLIFYFYFIFAGEDYGPNLTLFMLPVYLIILAGLGLGCGLIFSSLTTKYRDLNFLVSFGIRLLMYGTTVVYPLKFLKDAGRTTQLVVKSNPCTHILEAFRYSFTGAGEFSWLGIGYAFGFMVVLLTIGVILFKKTEQTFIDTV